MDKNHRCLFKKQMLKPPTKYFVPQSIINCNKDIKQHNASLRLTQIKIDNYNHCSQKIVAFDIEQKQ